MKHPCNKFSALQEKFLASGLCCRYICNKQSLFNNFVENPMPLSGVISKGISPSWNMVVLLLAFKNGQKRAILSIVYVF